MAPYRDPRSPRTIRDTPRGPTATHGVPWPPQTPRDTPREPTATMGTRWSPWTHHSPLITQGPPYDPPGDPRPPHPQPPGAPRCPPGLTETVELGVLVPYPEEGSEASDQRRPSALGGHRAGGLGHPGAWGPPSSTQGPPGPPLPAGGGEGEVRGGPRREGPGAVEGAAACGGGGGTRSDVTLPRPDTRPPDTPQPYTPTRAPPHPDTLPEQPPTLTPPPRAHLNLTPPRSTSPTLTPPPPEVSPTPGERGSRRELGGRYPWGGAYRYWGGRRGHWGRGSLGGSQRFGGVLECLRALLGIPEIGRAHV